MTKKTKTIFISALSLTFYGCTALFNQHVPQLVNVALVYAWLSILLLVFFIIMLVSLLKASKSINIETSIKANKGIDNIIKESKNENKPLKVLGPSFVIGCLAWTGLLATAFVYACVVSVFYLVLELVKGEEYV